MDAFQVGEDFVILGGRRANPWAGIFEKDLNFEMEFPRNFGMASFRNRDPRNGEAARFENRLDSRSTGNAYGRVALVPGLSGKGKVILIAGTNGVTTAAAGELLLQPWALKEIEHRLNRKLSPEISRLELLIETYAIGGGTRDFRIVAIR